MFHGSRQYRRINENTKGQYSISSRHLLNRYVDKVKLQNEAIHCNNLKSLGYFIMIFLIENLQLFDGISRR